MNFVEQMRGFWLLSDIMKSHGIPFKAAHNSLYLALFRMANDSGWKTWVTVTKKQGIELSGMSVHTYYKTLYELEKWGFLKIKNKHDRHQPIKIKLTICVSKVIHDNSERVSKVIHAYIKSDTRNQKSCIRIDTILKQKNKYSKQGEKIFFEGKKKNGNVLPPPTLQPI